MFGNQYLFIVIRLNKMQHHSTALNKVFIQYQVVVLNKALCCYARCLPHLAMKEFMGITLPVSKLSRDKAERISNVSSKVLYKTTEQQKIEIFNCFFCVQFLDQTLSPNF